MIWTIDIDLVSIWHYILIGFMLFFGLLGSFWNLEKKKSPIPIIFALFMSGIFYYYAVVIEPLIFGIRYADYGSPEYFLSGYIGILFLILFIEIFYNNFVKGTVVE